MKARAGATLKFGAVLPLVFPLGLHADHGLLALRKRFAGAALNFFNSGF
jgi:hypothetical protein